MANRDALNGGGDAVVALRLKRTAGVDAGTPPSGTAKTEPPPNVLPAQSGPISIWRPPDKIEEFRLIQPVGRGGMGEVFLAYDEILERHVAVKIIGGIDPDPASRERFMLEARAAARLQHPNVLTVYRVGEVEGRPYLATEFIHGTGLDEIDKPLSSRQVLQLGVGLARGLAAAHRRGVLHRDIKPGNAILPHDGEVKLLDFGLAKLLDPTAPFPGWRPTLPPGPVPPQPVVTAPVSRTGGTLVSIRAEAPTEPPASDGRTSLTDAGALMGTPDYMAPEIWRGEPATRRSDVYALGALLFELCAGRPPHRDVPARSLAQHVTKHDAPPLASVQLKVDPKLAEVIDRCLCRDPARRYASGDDLREALEQLELSSRVGVIPQGNPYRGLHTFEAEHRALFFGRRTEIGVFLERLRNETIVMVAGDSGVGKSSLCRAGILPAVQEGALGSGRVWSVLRMVPGRWPLLSLGAALAPLLAMDEGAVVRRLRAHPSAIARTLRGRLGDKTGVLLFIDQLEELVTVGEAIGAGIVAEVLGHLAQGLPGVRLLVTVRSDFLAQVASLPRLGDEIARSLVFLKALSPDGIREAITGPARITNVTFESEVLVETLVSSTSAADGGLPLLQFALAELWEARDQARGAITAEALDKIGGVAGALARHADEVVLGMTTVQRSAARRILFMLVSPQGTPVRRREDEIVAGDPEARAALHSLVRGRLLVVRDAEQGPTYELAHEALRRGWDTLRRWLDELAGSRAVRQRLAAAAMEWERLDRSRDVLWNVRQLNELGIVEPDDLLPREVAFAEASRAALRRTKRSRVALMAAFPFMVGAAYAALRLHARSELQQRVDAHVVEAERYIEAARLDEDASRAARREAFADFDNLHRHQGEVSWERARILAGKADVAYGHASQALETALMLGAGGHDIMGRLGDVLVARAELAERHHQLEQRDELLQRLALYDLGGLRRSRWAAPAEVSIHSTPAGAHVAIGRYMDDAQRRRRLVPLQRIDAGPASGVVLAPGSYLFSFELPGYAPARYPIVLERAERLVLTVPLLRAERVPDGFVYVAPGRFLFGSAADEEARRAFFNTAPLHETHTGAFLVARDETTWADWLHFLDALPPGERLLRTPRVAGLTGALELKELGAGAWTLTLQPSRRAYTAPMGEPIRYDARERRIVHDWLHLPVSGISLDDAQAYAAWLARTGRVPGARLCTEREWERAARGADGREFPNGDALEADDANIDETYGKDPLAFGPDEVGSHPTSQSPFGVNDTCGNVFEWTLSSLVPDEHALRGGAYYYDRTTARSANRQVSEPGIRDANVGIRICVTLE